MDTIVNLTEWGNHREVIISDELVEAPTGEAKTGKIQLKLHKLKSPGNKT